MTNMIYFYFNVTLEAGGGGDEEGLQRKFNINR